MSWKTLLVCLLGLFASVSAAQATCAPVPNSFTNGQSADATQVMGNFSYLVGCINALTEVDGVWTPTDASGAGLAFPSATGFYHKIGKNVLVWGFVTYPSTTSGVQAVIGNLPFTASNSSVNGFPSITLSTAVATTGFVNKNATTFGFAANGAAVNNSVISGNNVYFSGTYPTDN